jgi:molecular chaperone GrpE
MENEAWQSGPDSTQEPENWRRPLLDKFSIWLEEMDASARSAASVPEDPEGPDLHSLLSEMTALRQEVRLQTRQQAKESRELGASRGALETALQALQQNHSAAASEAAKQLSTWALALLDIRDALERGLAAAQRAAEPIPGWRRWLSRPTPSPALQSIEEGYRMAMLRCDRALVQHGVDVIETVGQRFDAATMVAVETSHQPGRGPDEVVLQVRSGCRHNQRILRCAEVVINKEMRAP